MHYYEIAVLGANLSPLTYSSKQILSPFCVVTVSVRSSLKRGVVIRECEKPTFKTLEIIENTGEYYTEFQISLAKFIAHYYICQIGVAFALFTPIKSQNSLNLSFSKCPNLSEKQKEALEFTKKNASALIFGDTGSGKSEIYISRIFEVLNQGKQALFLMPEISLTPQMSKRLEEYFGENLGIWHSKITKKRKSELIEGFQSGKIRLIAGARSALFLPFWDLGLIVVDEEHDDSYKSNENPRYNARDLALFIGKKSQIPVILGSATPSLTSYAKQPKFRLKGTFFQSEKEFIFDACKTEISPKIIDELGICLRQKHQAIVFLPTRANFKYMLCQNCNELVKCPFCSIAMSLHKDRRQLKCHYCGHTEFFKTKCKKCGGETFENRKMGTNEVISKLSEHFSEHSFVKFDRDEITTQSRLEKVLKRFNDGEIDVLVGTQMLSKGHDYHNVRLCVIMGLDDMLGYADFRARERTLALAIQLSGRSGRNGKGKVLIQSTQSDFFENYVSDYDAFLEDEKEFRNPLYPPFKRLLRVQISHKNDKTASEIMHANLARIKNAPNIEIIGYGKAFIEYIAAKFRYEILLRSDDHRALINAANLCDLSAVQIDIDPVSFA